MLRLLFIFPVVFAIVLIETGDAQPMQCGRNEEFLRCATGCPLYCNVLHSESCTRPCITGCHCKQGYLRHSSGDCVLASAC